MDATDGIPNGSGETTVDLAVGPSFDGTYDGFGDLDVLSERFAYTTESGESYERQFRLIGKPSEEIGIATGEYRETIWGFGQEPYTLVGTFNLYDSRAVSHEANHVPIANSQTVTTAMIV